VLHFDLRSRGKQPLSFRLALLGFYSGIRGAVFRVCFLECEEPPATLAQVAPFMGFLWLDTMPETPRGIAFLQTGLGGEFQQRYVRLAGRLSSNNSSLNVLAKSRDVVTHHFGREWPGRPLYLMIPGGVAAIVAGVWIFFLAKAYGLIICVPSMLQVLS